MISGHKPRNIFKLFLYWPVCNLFWEWRFKVVKCLTTFTDAEANSFYCLLFTTFRCLIKSVFWLFIEMFNVEKMLVELSNVNLFKFNHLSNAWRRNSFMSKQATVNVCSISWYFSTIIIYKPLQSKILWDYYFIRYSVYKFHLQALFKKLLCNNNNMMLLCN